MIAEIYMGGTSSPTYRISEVKKFECSMNGDFCRITDEEAWVFETSPKNVLLICEPPKGETE